MVGRMDILRAANMVLEQVDGDLKVATGRCEERIRVLAANGDQAGVETWKQIRDSVGRLHASKHIDNGAVS